MILDFLIQYYFFDEMRLEETETRASVIALKLFRE